MTLPKYEDHAEKMLDAIPEANYIACNIDKSTYWHKNKPKKTSVLWIDDNVVNITGYLGKFQCDDWKNSLIEKKWTPREGEKV